MKDFLIGHAHNDVTGVSVVLCPKGAVAGVSVRGGAPGTRETDLLEPHNMIEKIHAVALCGGSAFGLDACSGVMKYLHEQGIGFATFTQIVPIVCGAVIFDLRAGELVFPDANMGYLACKNAAEITKNSDLKNGQIGVGKGATTGKILGYKGIDRGGVGAVEVLVGSAKLAVIMAINAFGDVLDYKTQKIVAGARKNDGNFVGTSDMIFSQKNSQNFSQNSGQNTCIGVVFTDAKLTKAQAKKLADCAHDGLAKAISPVHTNMDGDTIFAMSCGEKQADFLQLCVAATEAVARACVIAVTA